MQTATITTPAMARIKKRTQKQTETPADYLFTRGEAKELLGDYAFSLIDEAKKTGAGLDEVLDRLDSENADTETFEDAALGRMMDEGLTGESVSFEEIMKILDE